MVSTGVSTLLRDTLQHGAQRFEMGWIGQNKFSSVLSNRITVIFNTLWSLFPYDVPTYVYAAIEGLAQQKMLTVS